MSAATNASSGEGGEEFRILQAVWDMRLGHEAFVQSPLWPVAMSVSFYFTLCTPFMVIDLVCYEQKWYKKYKIQPDKKVTMPLIYDTLNLTFWNQVLFILPAAMAQWIWVPPTELPKQAPTLFEFLWHQTAAIFIFDFQYFVWHWTHHKVLLMSVHFPSGPCKTLAILSTFFAVLCVCLVG